MSTTVQLHSGIGRDTRGIWSHTPGDAEETIQVAGKVFDAGIWNIDASGTYQPVKFSVSLSGSVSTVKIHTQALVSSGIFSITHSY